MAETLKLEADKTKKAQEDNYILELSNINAQKRIEAEKLEGIKKEIKLEEERGAIQRVKDEQE